MIEEAVALLLTERSQLPAHRVTPKSASVKVTQDLPRLVFSLISNPRSYTDSGAAGLRKARFQIDTFGATYVDARALILKITAPATNTPSPGLDGYKGTAANTVIRRIYFDEDGTGQAAAAPGQNQAIARANVDMLIDYIGT